VAGVDPNRLTAWWLGVAPSRQEELLDARDSDPPWLAESLAEVGLERSAVDEFLAAKRRERDDVSQDAGRDPGGPPH
jgi:hypothetical protein